ncbi:ribonuclease R [Fastidiosibacter lacustris]|uniref:ribonuclease R n=1 Tax=Fastidiosibacter lacustris TaxID=2056695 RepID=UPI0018651888|nr:ribonuclease R [Fastidiosibacter lacustris]
MGTKYTIKNDPNRENEAQKYDDPIPSRDVILAYLKDLNQPTVFENIAEALSLKRNRQLDALANRLGAMTRDEQLEQDGQYFRLFKQKQHIVTGIVRVENDGNAIVTTEDKMYSAFLPQHQAKLVFNGDKVCAVILGLNRKHKLEARIDSIIQRNTTEIIGRYSQQLDSHLIQPVSKTMSRHILLLPPKKALEPDALIKAKVIIYPSPISPAVAEFTELLEEQSPILTAISIASRKHNLIEAWSKKTEKFVTTLPQQVLPDEIIERVDLRHLPFVTIDGEDAKDFDDAVYAHKSSTDGWKLYVAIADVSYYVRADSTLDKDAQSRSTSVYFPGYVIPMLPEKISNELCSLKPNVDRLALICEMNISQSARLSRYKFYSGVINSKARLTYTEVSKLLNHKESHIYYQQPELVPNLFDLYDLYQILAKARKIRGAIDFDKVETQIILNEHNHIEAIVPRQRNQAHKVIEECMLMANVATAKFIEKHKAHAPFRVHGAPPSGKIEDLRAYLHSLGISFKPNKKGVTSADYSHMLEQAKDREDFANIQLMTLKSMNQAIYTPDNQGHFGLAYPAYTHFTSPIRRYPDLLTHRTIKSIISEKKFGAKSYTHTQLNELCSHASNQERNADSASTDVEKWLKCHFLHNRIGELFAGKIVHVTGFGMYVELIDNYIEGLVHISTMHSDYYIFDEAQHRLIGQRTKVSYSIGQKVQVQLVRVNLDEMQIDFELTLNGKGRSNIHEQNHNPHLKRKARIKSSEIKAAAKCARKKLATNRKVEPIKLIDLKSSNSQKTKKKKTNIGKNIRKKPNSKPTIID